MSARLEEPLVTNRPQSGALTASAVFDLLSNTRRRCVIHFLLDEPETTVRELSRHVAAWENDVELCEVSAAQRKRVYTGLHQTHLPRLDEHGVLQYDTNRGDVRATDRLEIFAPYFEPTETEGRAWHRYYQSIGGVFIAYSLAELVGLPVIDAVPPGIAALIAGSILGTVSVIHASEAGTDEKPTKYPDLRPRRAADEAPLGD